MAEHDFTVQADNTSSWSPSKSRAFSKAVSEARQEAFEDASANPKTPQTCTNRHDGRGTCACAHCVANKAADEKVKELTTVRA